MTTSARRPVLRTLADRVGILSAYVDVSGRRRTASDAARESILAAMGFDASTERLAKHACTRLADEQSTLLLPVVASASTTHRHQVALRLPRGIGRRRVLYDLELTDEAGTVRHQHGRLRRGRGQKATVSLSGPLTPGYYTLRVAIDGGALQASGTQFVIAAPLRCSLPRERLGRAQAFGLAVNLYALRSARNWGAGDFTDLTTLARWAGTQGAAFVAVNPLHALFNQEGAVSPYDPVSRLFRNPLYLDPEAAPEFRDASNAQALFGSPAYRDALAELRGGRRIEYERVMALKRPMFEALHRRFIDAPGAGGNARRAAYERFMRERGPALVDFATYYALAARFSPQWRRWPRGLRHPRSGDVGEFRESHAAEVDLQCYVQFELERQFAASAAAAERAGLEIGLFGDLAIGVTPHGSDTWAFPELFVRDARIGAPPDEYNAAGQDWGLAPIHPLRLIEDRCRYWVAVVRHALEHVGALRLDHVMGLFRQYWVPAGAGPTQGAYVRYPAEPLLSVLALESMRRRAVIVGEDLGTVPKGLPAILARRGILSMRLLYFERERGGAFRPARQYSRRALVSINTHDHPPFAGYWSGRDIELRRQLGVIRDQRALDKARAERTQTRSALLRRLTADKLLRDSGEPPPLDRLCGLVHSFLAATPSPLLSLSLDDLMGETEPINLPGVNPDRYPSWTRASRLPLEALASDTGVANALGELETRKGTRA